MPTAASPDYNYVIKLYDDFDYVRHHHDNLSRLRASHQRADDDNHDRGDNHHILRALHDEHHVARGHYNDHCPLCADDDLTPVRLRGGGDGVHR